MRAQKGQKKATALRCSPSTGGSETRPLRGLKQPTRLIRRRLRVSAAHRHRKPAHRCGLDLTPCHVAEHRSRRWISRRAAPSEARMPKPLQVGHDGPSATPADCEKHRAPATRRVAGHVFGRLFFSPVFFGRTKKIGSPGRAKPDCSRCGSDAVVLTAGVNDSDCRTSQAHNGSPRCFGLKAALLVGGSISAFGSKRPNYASGVGRDVVAAGDAVRAASGALRLP